MKRIAIICSLALVLVASLLTGCCKEVMAEALTAEELQQRATTFLVHLSKGEYAAAVEQFDETMKNAVPEEALKEAWEVIIASLGPLQSLGERDHPKII
jgi:hypothetical protein